eukprot:14030833-Heterocapsa_arctica.AAC.1
MTALSSKVFFRVSLATTFMSSSWSAPVPPPLPPPPPPLPSPRGRLAPCEAISPLPKTVPQASILHEQIKAVWKML